MFCLVFSPILLTEICICPQSTSNASPKGKRNSNPNACPIPDAPRRSDDWSATSPSRRWPAARDVCPSKLRPTLAESSHPYFCHGWPSKQLISLKVIYLNLHQLLQYQLNSMQRTHTLSSISYDFIARTAVVSSALYINQIICFNDSCLTANNYLFICINLCNLAFFSDCTLHLKIVKNKRQVDESPPLVPIFYNLVIIAILLFCSLVLLISVEVWLCFRHWMTHCWYVWLLCCVDVLWLCLKL